MASNIIAVEFDDVQCGRLRCPFRNACVCIVVRENGDPIIVINMISIATAARCRCPSTHRSFRWTVCRTHRRPCPTHRCTTAGSRGTSTFQLLFDLAAVCVVCPISSDSVGPETLCSLVSRTNYRLCSLRRQRGDMDLWMMCAEWFGLGRDTQTNALSHALTN